MYSNYRELKTLKSENLNKFFLKENSLVLIFSCLDLSNRNISDFKSFLLTKNIRLIFVKKTLLKKILKPFPGFSNVEKLLNGPLLIGIPNQEKNIYDFSLNLEKRHKVVILGAFLNNQLYSNSFVKKISDITPQKIYTSLISVCLQKQLLLTYLLSQKS